MFPWLAGNAEQDGVRSGCVQAKRRGFIYAIKMPRTWVRPWQKARSWKLA